MPKESKGVSIPTPKGRGIREEYSMNLDILAENLIEDEVVEKSILPDLMNTMISDKLGFDVEVKDMEIDE
jgi:hypothetical protein